MRKLIFKDGSYTDPIKIGDVLECTLASTGETVVVIASECDDPGTCFGCCKYERTGCMCRVPRTYAEDDIDESICFNTMCIFKAVDDILEDL